MFSVKFLPAYNLLLQTSAVQDTVAADFSDLGTLLLGGFVTAIVVALGFTFVRLRLRDRRPASSQFVSIAAANQSDSSEHEAR